MSSVDPASVDPTNVDPVETGYTADGVPTFDHVRESIERRVTTAMGAEELAGATPSETQRSGARPSSQARTLAEQEADREAAGRDKLEEIRRSLRGEG